MRITDMVSTRELTEALGYGTTSIVNQLLARGRLPTPARLGRTNIMFWSRDQIERWLREPADTHNMAHRKQMALAAFLGVDERVPVARRGRSAEAAASDRPSGAAEAAGGRDTRPGEGPAASPKTAGR